MNDSSQYNSHEKDILALFKNFLERNNLPKLIIISLKNSFYSNTVPMELNEITKALKEFDIYDKALNALFKQNKNIANEMLFFYEHLALLYYYKQEYSMCYEALKHSLKYLEKFSLEKNFLPSKLKNCFNKIECLSIMIKVPDNTKIKDDLSKIKTFIDEYHVDNNITEFLERLIYYYYKALINLILNNIGNIAPSIKKFNQEVDTFNKSQQDKEPNHKVEEVKDFLELKVRLLAVKIYEKRNPLPYNDILVMCDTIRTKYKEYNHDFFIKLNLKIADSYYYCSDYYSTNKTIAFINNFINDLILYPKISKIRFKVLTYAKLLATSLIIGNYTNFETVLNKVITNFERIKKFKIQASRRTLSLIEMSFLNNISLHKFYFNFPLEEAEKTLNAAKEINSNGNNMDPNSNFAIENNLCCFSFFKGNHEFALQSWKKLYQMLLNTPDSERFYFVLNNLAICTKIMQMRGTYMDTQDDSDHVINKFKEISTMIFQNGDNVIKTIGDVKNLVFLYNYMYFAIVSQAINFTQVSFDAVNQLLYIAEVAWKIQGRDENIYNIWRCAPDLILKLLYVHALLFFYKNDLMEALNVLKKVDEVSKIIDIDTDYNIIHNVKLIKLRADILFKLKNYSECINDYRIVLTIYDKKLNLGKSDKRAVILCNLAQALVFQNCFESAKEYLLQAETLFNRNSGDNKLKLEKVRMMLSFLN